MLGMKMRPVYVALIAGLLQITIFPPFAWGWLAFLCLAPLFLLIERRSPRQLFFNFWLAAFVFRLGDLYWIAITIGHYTALPIAVSAGVVVLLCAFMALFWGITGWLLGRIGRGAGVGPALAAAPFLWVAQEYAVNVLQFPWDLLGYSQYAALRLAQARRLHRRLRAFLDSRRLQCRRGSCRFTTKIPLYL